MSENFWSITYFVCYQPCRLNNYTQIIWAETWRIGCAAGSYSEGFALVCNYHGIKTANDVAWRIGDTCSKCPRNLPICDTYFQSLCTAGKMFITRCIHTSHTLSHVTRPRHPGKSWLGGAVSSQRTKLYVYS